MIHEYTINAQQTIMASNQEQAGGYDCNWVEDPPDDLKCLICRCVAKDPQQHGNAVCGKVFCDSCLTEYKKTSNECPNCHELLSTFQDGRGTRNINALKVKCDNLENGCQWVDELGSLEEHLQTCKYTLLSCPNECKNGDQIVEVLRKDLQEHLENECPRRQYECPHCNETGEYQERTTTHLETCPQNEVTCPNDQCQVSIPRCEVSTHRSTCDYELVSCKYAEVGCKMTTIRKELNGHENDDQFHLRITTKTVLELKREIKKSYTPCTFRMTNFTQCKTDNCKLFSLPFYTSYTGYKMKVCMYANGWGDGEGTHVSVGVCLMKGDNDDSLTWPFTGTVTVELLNQLEDKNHHKLIATFSKDIEHSKRVVDGERGRTWGRKQLIAHADLAYNQDKNCQYLKDDLLVFRISAQVPDYKPWLECTM